jgi:hypothetical protein
MEAKYQILDEQYRRDPHKFIFEALRTKDEHNKEHPIGRFPDELCLRATIDDYLVGGKIIRPEDASYSLAAGTPLEHLQHLYLRGISFTEKSRHVMVTWITCSYLLWRARYLEYQLIMVQSKREEDVAALVYDKEPDQARISFLEWKLPEPLHKSHLPKDGKYCHMYFPETGSHIWGIPEGGHIIRSHNPSVIFSDEAAFQPEFSKAYTAALPAITHGGQLIVVSSANPSEFMKLVEYDEKTEHSDIIVNQ